jgi:hypothetical protein
MCYESELTTNMIIMYLENDKRLAYFEALQVGWNFILRCPMGMVIESLCYLEVGLKNHQKWFMVGSGGPCAPLGTPLSLSPL